MIGSPLPFGATLTLLALFDVVKGVQRNWVQRGVGTKRRRNAGNPLPLFMFLVGMLHMIGKPGPVR